MAPLLAASTPEESRATGRSRQRPRLALSVLRRMTVVAQL
eukprot:CAMPEP_0176331692 /NCGR_PEP_ID=MMETSP0121_2-20121125/76681_1 /TAXON_ID=160619 /ORGANISM="Kryptoperidinium foliaceum, Strain CCMP 1326" /LENGTH=39 /DNA_ID= /DNA_START= /DNA_END= /DNA_ORIENTATION=